MASGQTQHRSIVIVALKQLKGEDGVPDAWDSVLEN